MKKEAKVLERFISVVWVLRDSVDALRAHLQPLQEDLEANFTDYEILLIDQRSHDGTADYIEAQLKAIPSVRFIELSFRVAQDVAIVAGLENSIGDYVVIMDPERDSVREIRPIVDAALEGADIVYGTAPLKRSLAYRMLRPLAGKVLSRIGYNVPQNATGFMTLSRRAANAVMSVGRFHHQFFVRLAKTGYVYERFSYQINIPEKSSKNAQRGAYDLVQMVIHNSTLPLRWMSVAGILGSGFAFLFALYSFLIRLLMENVAAGWASSVMFQSCMFMLLFTMLAFFGEYLARLLDDQSGMKSYSVVYEKHSSVLLNENRRNVQQNSID